MHKKNIVLFEILKKSNNDPAYCTGLLISKISVNLLALKSETSIYTINLSWLYTQ